MARGPLALRAPANLKTLRVTGRALADRGHGRCSLNESGWPLALRMSITGMTRMIIMIIPPARAALGLTVAVRDSDAQRRLAQGRAWAAARI